MNRTLVFNLNSGCASVSSLSGISQVGAATEAELEDRKLRIEDAKNATFAAVEEGIVPGGGAALLHLSELVPAFKETLKLEEEKMVGFEDWRMQFNIYISSIPTSVLASFHRALTL